MPVNKFPVKKVIILVLLVVCFAIGCCKRSKAETVIIGPEMPPTFDPNMGLDTPVPEPTEEAEPSASPEPVDEDPSFPPLLAPGGTMRMYNLPGLVWYDETADAYKVKRAYGSVTNITLPFTTSSATSIQIGANTYGENKGYIFNFDSPLISESTTSHFYGKGLFQFWFYNIFNAGQVVSPNALYYTIDLNDFRLYCSDPAYTYNPFYQVQTYVYYGTANGSISNREVIVSELKEYSNDGMGDRYICVEVPHDRPGFSILGVSIRIRFGSIDVFEGFPVEEDPQRSVIEPTYYYDCSSYQVICMWSPDQSYQNKETKNIISSIGGFFTDLWHNYTTFFMPDSEMLTEWIEEHAIDPDEDNPLLVVRGLFQSILQMFSSSENLRTPVFQIPALTFTVGGQTVTPFTGYQFNLADADIPISGGTTLFYWSRLFGTMGVITGFIGLLWSYFSKFFDAHYAKGIMDAGGDE